MTPHTVQEADTAPHDCRHHETGTLWSARGRSELEEVRSVPVPPRVKEAARDVDGEVID